MPIGALDPTLYFVNLLQVDWRLGIRGVDKERRAREHINREMKQEERQKPNKGKSQRKEAKMGERERVCVCVCTSIETDIWIIEQVFLWELNLFTNSS